ncbi:MAG: YcxB family protein [Hyphomicrobiaceae bacterium]
MPLTARVTLMLEDYVALCEAFGRLTPRRRFGRVVHYVVPVAVAAGAIYFTIERDWAMAGFYAALFAILLAINVLLTPWSRRRSFVSQRLGEHEVTISADEQGFRSSTALVDANHRWDVIRHADYSGTHVIMWPNPRIGYIVPLRGFATEDEARAFVDLVRRSVVEKPL